MPRLWDMGFDPVSNLYGGWPTHNPIPGAPFMRVLCAWVGRGRANLSIKFVHPDPKVADIALYGKSGLRDPRF